MDGYEANCQYGIIDSSYYTDMLRYLIRQISIVPMLLQYKTNRYSLSTEMGWKNDTKMKYRT